MLWIKQPNGSPAEVTGTVVMMVDDDKGDAASDGLKRNTNGVILHPQPHVDPNDPLNWPMWRRDLAMLTIGIYSFIVGGQTPLLAAVMGTLSKEWDEPLHKLTYLVGVLMLGMGVGSLFFAPTAVLFGKRLVYLASQLIFFAGLIWGANAKSFGSLVGARVLCGIGGGPAESLPSATIAEIYFAHERAYRTGIYTLLLLGGKNLVPLVAGFVANTCGWHWVFYVVAIIVGGCWVATFFFVHETWWDRSPIPNKRSQKESEKARAARLAMNRPDFDEVRNRMRHPSDLVVAQVASASLQDPPEKREDADESVMSSPDNSHEGINNEGSVTRTPFFRNLQVYSGRKSPDPWYKVFLRPFFLYCYPPIIFSTMLYSLSVVWLSVIAETLSSIFTAAPYNFKITSVGLLYIGTFVGGCLGSALAGYLSDAAVRVMARRNHGVYEPEYRLVMILPVAVTTAIGIIGFGWSVFEEDAWIVPCIFLGFIGFGTSLGSTVSITYAVDSYKMFAAEALVSLNFFKNLLGFCFCIFVPYFLQNAGRRTSYVVYGCIELAICLLAIPLYRYGKVLRAYRDDHNIIERLYK